MVSVLILSLHNYPVAAAEAVASLEIGHIVCEYAILLLTFSLTCVSLWHFLLIKFNQSILWDMIYTFSMMICLLSLRYLIFYIIFGLNCVLKTKLHNLILTNICYKEFYSSFEICIKLGLIWFAASQEWGSSCIWKWWSLFREVHSKSKAHWVPGNCCVLGVLMSFQIYDLLKFSRNFI